MKNEPAFPVGGYDGITFRDYFAIRFASVMLGAPRQRNERRLNTATITHRAYELADAMLEARSK